MAVGHCLFLQRWRVKIARNGGKFIPDGHFPHRVTIAVENTAPQREASPDVFSGETLPLS
jgi:hypothetical protein